MGLSRWFPKTGNMDRDINTDRPRKTRPVLLEVRSSKWFICFVVSFAVFVDIFLYGVIVPVTPTALEEKVGLPIESQQRWTSILLSLYGATLLVVSPISGYIADRSESRQWPFLIGLLALGGSTAMLCAGNHIGLWVAGRLLQGASTAVVWTVGLALLVDTVGRDELGQAVGYVGMAMSTGIMAGPLLGGVIYQSGGYYAVWATALGLIGFDIVLRLVMIEKKHAMLWIRDPSVSVSEQTEGKGSVSTSSNQSTDEGLKNSNGNTGDRETEPSNNTNTNKPHLVPALLTLLKSKRMLAALWGYFTISILMTSFDSVLPIFVQETFTWQQTAQGLIFIPLSVPHILEPVIGSLVDKHNKEPIRYLAAGGFLCAVPPLTLLRFITHDSTNHKILLCVLLTIIGLCIAIATPPVMTEFSCVVNAKEETEKSRDIFGKGGAMAQAYGLMNSAFAAGSLVGPVLAGFVRERFGWGVMGWGLGLVSGVSAVPMVLVLGGWIGGKKMTEAEAEAEAERAVGVIRDVEVGV